MRKLLLVLLAFSVFGTASASDLEVTVHGIEAPYGQLLIGVFTSAENFRVAPQEGSAMIQIAQPGAITHSISGLAPGFYAVVAFWDQNKNGVLDTGAFGKPVEPFVFSGNPAMRLGPPRFEECTIAVGEQGGRLVMHLGP